MKTKFHLIAGVAMIAALASCSNDDLVVNPEVKNPFNMTSTGYAKVAITMPNNGTRADGGLAEGTAAEATIKTISLALYNADGGYVGYGQLISDAPAVTGTHPDGTAASDKYEKNLFQLHYLEDGVEPTQIVAFINTPLVEANLDALTNGTEARTIVSEYFDGQGDGANNFAMTSSGYYDGSNYVVAAPLTVAAIANTKEEATDLAATIYVERLAAKINVKSQKEAYGKTDDTDYMIVDVDGQDVELTFTPTAWGATGVAQSEYLVKKKFDAYKDETWAKGTNRSYWAEAVNYFTDFDGYYKDGETQGLLTYITFADVDNYLGEGATYNGLTSMASSLYVPEHTTKLNITDDNPEYLIANTYALVLGTYAVNGTYEYGTEENADFYLLLSGMVNNKTKYVIYNKEQLIEYLLKYNGINPEEVTCEEGDGLTDWFNVEPNAEGKYILTLAKDGVKEGETDLTAEQLTKPTNSRHYHYKNGLAYFNAKIEHQDGIYGVVRNHSYQLTITAVNSLGLPLDDDAHKGEDGEIEPDPIIPDPDDMKNHFINATIEVLSWHVINNDVTL